jgi:hypothetical protein
LSTGTTFQFFINGQLQTYSADYTILGTTLTIVSDRPAPTPTDVLILYGSIGTVSPTLTVSGSTGTVNNVGTIAFNGASVTNNGGGTVTISITGGTSATSSNESFSFVVGSSTVVTTGTKNNTRFIAPISGTIIGWKLIVDTGSTVTLDVWKSTGIPTNSDSITGSAKPSLTSSQFATSSTLTGWTTAVSVNDIFILEVESNNNASYINLALIIQI